MGCGFGGFIGVIFGGEGWGGRGRCSRYAVVEVSSFVVFAPAEVWFRGSTVFLDDMYKMVSTRGFSLVKSNHNSGLAGVKTENLIPALMILVQTAVNVMSFEQDHEDTACYERYVRNS